MRCTSIVLSILLTCPSSHSFLVTQDIKNNLNVHASLTQRKSTLYALPPTEEKIDTKTNNDAILSLPTEGGYTLKQRLREEIDSPFRKVRLAFFGASFGSALIALYFSALNTIKASVGGFSDAMPLEEALTSDAINLGAVIVCGLITYRDYKAGEANLEKLARAGKLASLVVEPASSGKYLELKSYRRNNRVLIAAGGKEYISSLALSLTSDQLKDRNILPEKLEEVDVTIVPVLLEEQNSKLVVGDTKSFWNEVTPSETDRNFDRTKANNVISYPIRPNAWLDYLNFDIKTASKQGFDVANKGITILVKKNGKILRRSTGLPSFGDLIGTMEVMDGSRFGMPGDSERYGGP